MDENDGMSDETPAPAPVPAPGSREARPDPKLLELLVCPLTKTSLAYDPKRGELVSAAAKLAFPIRDGIPIMLASEARRLED